MQFGGIGGVGGGQHLGGERVVVGPAERDAGVRQVGVDVEVPVAGWAAELQVAVTPARTSATIRSRPVPRRRSEGRSPRRPRPPGSPDRPRPTGPAPPRTARTSRAPGCPASRVRSGVDGAVRPGVVVVHQPEAAADHRVAHLADRQRPGTGHGQRSRTSRSAPVNSSIVVAALEAVDAVPQRQHLRVAQQVADAPSTTSRSPSADCGRPAPTRPGTPTNTHRPAGQQVPRPLTGLRMRRVFLVDRELVADPPVGDQLTVAGHLDQRLHPPPRAGRPAAGGARWRSPPRRSRSSPPSCGPS